jgi:outer membrane protein OmpA-like peptidoglycan-associated protein
VRDKCPNEPETFNGYQDEDGCPDEKPKEEKVILEGVNFKPGSAELIMESYAALDKVAQSLLGHPEIVVEIHGYTDSIGDRAFNKRLSQRRAEAVLNYLVSKGLSPARLKAIGFGEENPIADNRSPEGRAKNRRVELLRRK